MQTNPSDGKQDESAQNTFRNSDIQDSQRDIDRLSRDEVTLDLPEVRDIPGQEHIHVLPLGDLADTTISSDDEEGVGILDELEEEEETGVRTMGTESDLSSAERVTLETGDDFRNTRDEEELRKAGMDSTDFEGETLNEAGFGDEKTGSDLDMANTEDDDSNENVGEEDEENNFYSLGSGNKD